ncbi:MAG: hypothetical protein ABIC91_00920 [Nanoarchaeota archaeon]|nr:hypothetical protein [Nanoarchaeota archaeon]MBU1029944.1 hypothetical protein [Nanoarchaeota archaeon]MBU1849233.1 hypothetical protein [Nanoarchaeota archaeon]
MKPVRIGVAGYCPPTKYNKNKALQYLEEAFDKVENDFPDREIIIVSGVTNVGVLAQAYALATKKGYKTGGVTSEKAAEYELFSTTEKPIIVGKEWGAESPVFIHGIDAIKDVDVDPEKVFEYSGHPHYGLDAMIRIGLGPQSIRETNMLKSMGKPTYEFDLPKFKKVFIGDWKPESYYERISEIADIEVDIRKPKNIDVYAGFVFHEYNFSLEKNIISNIPETKPFIFFQIKRIPEKLLEKPNVYLIQDMEELHDTLQDYLE